MNPSAENVKFLIVDDDKISVLAMQRAMRKLNIANDTHVCSDGQEAFEFLQSELERSKGLPPYIITLDLNMPRMNGHEFLDAIRKEPDLNRMVVFVFSTSNAPQDMKLAFERHVAGYVVKEDPTETLRTAFTMLQSYCQVMELPA